MATSPSYPLLKRINLLASGTRIRRKSKTRKSLKKTRALQIHRSNRMAHGLDRSLGTNSKLNLRNRSLHHRIRTLRKILNLLHRMVNHSNRKTRWFKNILRKSRTLDNNLHNNRNHSRLGTNNINQQFLLQQCKN